jgi:hypothetical protein
MPCLDITEGRALKVVAQRLKFSEIEGLRFGGLLGDDVSFVFIESGLQLLRIALGRASFQLGPLAFGFREICSKRNLDELS